MDGTILYRIDETQAAAAAACGSVLEVLTVASSVDGVLAAQHVSSGGKTLSQAGGGSGLAGHVLLTRPSGGMLLTSMGSDLHENRSQMYFGITNDELCI